MLVYQETYHRETYAEHHLKGKRSDFNFRLETHDRLGKAGIQKMGLGCLIGLKEWRKDCFYVAAHLTYLERKYWQSRYTLSFPRLRPCAGSLEVKSEMNDKQLDQFEISDQRPLQEMVSLIKFQRYEAVWKERDPCLMRSN